MLEVESGTGGSASEAIPLPSRIEHTLLRPEATRDRVEVLAAEAAEHGMAAAVVLPGWVPVVAAVLEGTPVAICSVVGFPLAHESLRTLESASADLVSIGADEIDMVISTGALLSGQEAEVAAEIETVVSAARRENPDCLIKVIMETHLLDDEVLVAGCRLVEEAGADFVKTTTGFTGGGATPEVVRRLRSIVGDRLGVKASAGIRSLDQAEALVAAGANRLGTSCGAEIATEWREKRNHAHPV